MQPFQLLKHGADAASTAPLVSFNKITFKKCLKSQLQRINRLPETISDQG